MKRARRVLSDLNKQTHQTQAINLCCGQEIGESCTVWKCLSRMVSQICSNQVRVKFRYAFQGFIFNAFEGCSEVIFEVLFHAFLFPGLSCLLSFFNCPFIIFCIIIETTCQICPLHLSEILGYLLIRKQLLKHSHQTLLHQICMEELCRLSFYPEYGLINPKPSQC